MHLNYAISMILKKSSLKSCIKSGNAKKSQNDRNSGIEFKIRGSFNILTVFKKRYLVLLRKVLRYLFILS